MEASIRDPNIKNFVRLLQCASRFGDELCMHATKDSWELSVTNSSKSAFCLFTLKPSFFSRYKATGTPDQQRRGVKCQLYAKSVLSVLGKASSVNTVDRVDLKIIDPDGGLRATTQRDEEEEEEDDIRVAERSAQLEMKLLYHHNITKKHFLHVQSSDFLRAVVDPDSTPSGFQISARTLRDWLDHFNIAFSSATSANGAVRGDSQLAWRFGQTEVQVKNFENASTSALSTEIKIDVAEFEDYEVLAEAGHVDLALPMREFKATLQLAEQFGMDLDFFFSEATQPLTISSRYMGLDRYSNESELFSIFCVIATTTCEAFANVPASAPVAVNGSRADRSESVKVKPEPGVPGSVRKRRAPDGSGRAGSSRPPRASLSLSAQPPPMVTVVGTAAAAVASQAMSQAAMSQAAMSQSDMSQGPSRTRNPNAEPLFLPSQTQRMTQQEVLDMAGMGDIDLEAMMDDADAEDAEESRLESGAPADWDEVEFQNLRADLMSTQQNTDPGTSQRIVSPLRRQTQAIDLSDTEFEPNTDIFGDTTSISPVKTQRRSRSRSKSRQRERSRSRTQENSPPPGMDAREELDDDDEFEADEFDPTQPSGRKFESFFTD